MGVRLEIVLYSKYYRKHCILDIVYSSQSQSNDNNFETRILLLVDSI